MLFCPVASLFAAEGDTIVVLEQNFDVFTEGSEDAPAATDISSYTGKLRTTLSGWSGSKVYEAGGCLKIGDNGYIQTTNTNMSAGGGYLRISFRVKSLQSTGGIVRVYLNSSYTVTSEIHLFDSEWTEVEAMASGGSASSYVRLAPYLIADGILIDDLKIEASENFLAAPEATQPTVANGTSFTATWKVVSGATGYLLDVYSKNGDEKDYVLHDEAVAKPASAYATTHSRQVTGLDAQTRYYFTVRAVRNDVVSAYSNEIEVVKVISSLAAPVAKEATDVTTRGFTANWSAVDDATGYEVSLYRKEILTKDTAVSVFADDFSGFTAGTLTSPDYPSSYALDNYTALPGWSGYLTCSASGYFGISTYGTPGYICTPAVDLQADGGKFTLTINAAAYYYGTYKDDEVKVYIYNGQDEKVDSAVITLTGEFKDYTFSSSEGTEETYVYIEYNGSNKFFMDELTLSQQMHAGDVVTTLVDTKDVGNVTSYHFDVDFADNVSYSYRVSAYAPTVGGSSYTGYYVTDIFSNFSNEIVVSAPTGIDNLTGGEARHADNAWYTLQGMRLDGRPTQAGIYIVKGRKVIIR